MKYAGSGAFSFRLKIDNTLSCWKSHICLTNKHIIFLWLYFSELYRHSNSNYSLFFMIIANLHQQLILNNKKKVCVDSFWIISWESNEPIIEECQETNNQWDFILKYMSQSNLATTLYLFAHFYKFYVQLSKRSH